MVCDHYVYRIEPIDLMGEQVGSLVVSIICNYEAFAWLLVASLLCILMVAHDELEDLSRLATWSCTHIKYRVM